MGLTPPPQQQQQPILPPPDRGHLKMASLKMFDNPPPSPPEPWAVNFIT